jgi:hypothetical protein
MPLRLYAQARRPVGPKQHPYQRRMEDAVLHRQAVARILLQLKEKGWCPDAILAHPGWGETLCAKDVFPDARLVHDFYTLNLPPPTAPLSEQAMSRPLRIEFPGAACHVTSIGDRFEATDADDGNRAAFRLGMAVTPLWRPGSNPLRICPNFVQCDEKTRKSMSLADKRAHGRVIPPSLR